MIVVCWCLVFGLGFFVMGCCCCGCGWSYSSWSFFFLVVIDVICGGGVSFVVVVVPYK